MRLCCSQTIFLAILNPINDDSFKHFTQQIQVPIDWLTVYLPKGFAPPVLAPTHPRVFVIRFPLLRLPTVPLGCHDRSHRRKCIYIYIIVKCKAEGPIPVWMTCLLRALLSVSPLHRSGRLLAWLAAPHHAPCLCVCLPFPRCCCCCYYYCTATRTALCNQNHHHQQQQQ